MVLKVSLNTGINRIRLEFKATCSPYLHMEYMVLIESDWNLKYGRENAISRDDLVLIESDWNLKLY